MTLWQLFTLFLPDILAMCWLVGMFGIMKLTGSIRADLDNVTAIKALLMMIVWTLVFGVLLFLVER